MFLMKRQSPSPRLKPRMFNFAPCKADFIRAPTGNQREPRKLTEITVAQNATSQDFSTNGVWFYDDDGGGDGNTNVDFCTPTPGDYLIYAGTFGNGPIRRDF